MSDYPNHCTHCTPTAPPLYPNLGDSGQKPILPIKSRLGGVFGSSVVVEVVVSSTVPPFSNVCKGRGVPWSGTWSDPSYMAQKGYSGRSPISGTAHTNLNDEQTTQLPSSTVPKIRDSGSTVGYTADQLEELRTYHQNSTFIISAADFELAIIIILEDFSTFDRQFEPAHLVKATIDQCFEENKNYPTGEKTRETIQKRFMINSRSHAAELFLNSTGVTPFISL